MFSPVHGIDPIRLIYLGGPSAVLEWRTLRMVTDPSFDPAGTTYELPGYTLRKTDGPALTADQIGPIDAVLLSHDHHFDNLDNAGREFIGRVPVILTTQAGAGRLGDNAVGLEPWTSAVIGSTNEPRLIATATPAQHGPAGADRGPVIGFVLFFEDERDRGVYISGDTVWFEAIAEVATRFDIRVAILNLGAARIAAAGGEPLTFTAAEAINVARVMPEATIVPMHFEGWAHLSESRSDIESAFHSADLADRLRWPDARKAIAL